MKKYLLIPVLILLALTQANSQVRCGFDGVLNAELEKDPKYSINIEEVNAKIERQIMRQKTFNSVDDIVYIPVVFHILHRGGAVGAYDNPTDASVISTVDYLNKVYDGTWNGTGGSILGVGDVNIKFVLATKDPDNNTTTGIERIDASSIGDYSSSGLKLRGTSGVDEATLKNLSRWDPFKYYNIWVVHEIDGCGGSPNNCSSWTGGFAYFPFEPVGVSTLSGAGTRDRDGTVMLATGMSPGNALLPHEIGHALNLYHPFQGTDNTGACPPADPTEGDRCADTDPITNPQGAWNTYSGYARDGSPYPLSNPNSCADGKPYNELTEKNFMNYTFTTRLFTADQKNRMKASVMSTIREGLSTSWANNKGAYPTTWVAPKAAVVTPVTSETGMGGIYAGIYRVELNDMIVNSLVTNQEGGYLNNADKWYNLFSIKAGSTYTMKVNIFNGSNNNQLGVYIDYDNDGAFNETTEKIFLDTNIPTSDGTGYTSEKSITFTVPASASMSTGSIVRMRVINDLSSIYGLAPVSGSSSSLSYGQAEDYAIYLGADNAVTLSSAAGTDSQTACINMAIINITYATTGATGATFSGLPTGVSGNWSANVVTISGTPSVVGASQPYTITLTGGSGAVTTTGTLTVVSTISPSFTQVGPVCSGASLSALPTTSTNGITGTWSPVINNTATTNYTFTPSEEGQCTTTASMTITVNTLPTAAITNNTATTVLTCSTAAISVTATGGVSYAWNNSLGTNATANITAAGTYTVTVTNANGCTDTQSITITENLSYTEIYVNKTATGNNNGTSWTDAFTDLQDAIDVNCSNVDIWVAVGTYYPTKDHTGNTSPSDNRDKNFHLHTDMKIYGGFAGGETQLSARNAAANITILSGDFNNDDTVTGGGSTLSITGNTENAYHVMLTADLTNAAVIDGFTIKGGNAGGGSSTITYQSKSFSTSDGGGMYNESSSPTITNSTFANNYAEYGGGMANDSSSPTITNSTFTNNSAGDGGGMANNSSSPTITNSTFADNNAEYAGGMANLLSSPTITNSTFANNYANLGGGMANDFESSPTITNSTFANNYAEYGGGMANDSSSPTITNSTFTNNSAGDGGGMANNSSSPTITNSTFANNDAGEYGGGMSNYSSSPTITNSTFANNNSGYYGGGMDNYSSSPTITNSTFANNYAEYGGGMANDFESSPTITNSIIWSNGSTEVVINDRSTPTFKSSIIKSSNGSGGSWNTAYGTDNGDNLDTDPLFVNAANGDYRVQSCSPAIDAGDNAAWTTTTLSTDMAGNTRPFNSGIVDMGAYEYQGIPYTTAIYVNKAATGSNDGSSWTDAYTDLQDAIDNQCGGFDIWVAAGTYYPTKDHTGNTSPTDNRDKNFHLGTDMKIYGGFAGTETQLSARDAAANITRLSGDIDNASGGAGNAGNAYHVIITADLTVAAVIDGFTIEGGNANGSGTISYQSISFYRDYGGGMGNYSSSPTITNSTFTNNNSAFDGGGMLNYSSSSPTITNSTFANNYAEYGGGMSNYSSSPTITNSTFTNNNSAGDGGGMANLLSSPTITNSTFTNNNSAGDGGGMSNSSSSPTITNSTFTNNNANSDGGGMYNYGSSPTITNSTFTNNYAGDGGGMANNSSSPTITNSTFADNNAGYYGGGMANLLSSPTITNSTFANNYADLGGGGMYNYYLSSPTITNSTFTNNNSDYGGGGMYNTDSSSPTITNSTFANNYAEYGGGGMVNINGCSPMITNSIIWNNGSSEVFNNNGTPIFKNSIIKDSGGSGSWNTAYGTDNGDNLDTDPLFVNAVSGDYTLQGCSPAIDTGDNAAWTTTTLITDIAGNTRPFNSTVDIGAYEYQGIPIAISIAAPTVTQPTCAVPSGTIVVNATTTSGTLEYSIDNGSTYQASATFSGLSGGSYTIKAREQGSSCTETYGSNPVVINTPVILTIAAPTVTQPTCAVPSGTIVVNATTTSGTLEYSVDNGSTYQTESTFSGLSAGSYTITVREQGSSCTETYGSNPVVINTPVILTIAAPTVTQPTCAVPSGTIVVNATTTSGTLEYSVDNGSTYQASNTFGGLSGGSYTIKIRVEGSVCEGTYGSNPVAIDTLLLTYELTPSISVSQTELCVGESITLSATNIPNSVDGATIHWTGGFTGESITVSPSTSGDFRVAVRSANGCLSDSSDAVSITVNQLPSNPVITSDNASLCTGETVTLSGSCETNTVFSWITPVENTNGATTSALSNSNQRVINAAGTYTGYCETTTGCRSGEVSIVITESTNCGSEQVIAISPAKPTICPGEVISLTASGCTGTLTWSGGLASQIGSTASFNPVIATTYSVTCSTGGSGTVDVSVVKANEVISSNISTGTSQVRALETIQSDKKIGDTNVTPAPNVIFQSGKSILLSPGFEVTTESVFKAIIQITCPEQ